MWLRRKFTATNRNLVKQQLTRIPERLGSGTEDRNEPKSGDKTADANEPGDMVKNGDGEKEVEGNGASNSTISEDDDKAEGVVKAADDIGYDSDESQDDEDRGETDFSTTLTSDYNDEDDEEISVRQMRYELLYWDHHLREAEERWTPEERKESKKWADVMDELDIFSNLEGHGNQAFFDWWQQVSSIMEGDDQELHWKPLHVAAALSLTAWIKHLLAKGCDIMEMCQTGGYDRNAAQIAAAYGRFDTLKLLVENEADLNAEPSPEHFRSAFHSWLFRDSSYENVRCLLEHGADPIVVNKKEGWNSLHFLAGTGDDVKTLDLLLNHEMNGRRVDINAVDLLTSPCRYTFCSGGLRSLSRS